MRFELRKQRFEGVVVLDGVLHRGDRGPSPKSSVGGRARIAGKALDRNVAEASEATDEDPTAVFERGVLDHDSQYDRVVFDFRIALDDGVSHGTQDSRVTPFDRIVPPQAADTADS